LIGKRHLAPLHELPATVTQQGCQMSRPDLTNTEWNAIRHFLPARKTGRPGRPWAKHRRVINGILWILKTGSPWRDLPEEFGKWQTVYNRFGRSIIEGVWDRIYCRLLQRAN
jgi:transposase